MISLGMHSSISRWGLTSLHTGYNCSYIEKASPRLRLDLFPWGMTGQEINNWVNLAITSVVTSYQDSPPQVPLLPERPGGSAPRQSTAIPL